MLTIKDIQIDHVLELKVFQQSNHTRITLVRGHRWYARLVNDELQEWCGLDVPGYAIQEFNKLAASEFKSGSKLL